MMSKRVLTNKFYLLLLIPLIILQSSASNTANISNRKITLVLNINNAYYTDLGGDKLFNDIIVNFTTSVNYNLPLKHSNLEDNNHEDNVHLKSCVTYHHESEDDPVKTKSYENLLTINKIQNSNYHQKDRCMLIYHLKLTLTLPSGINYNFRLKLIDSIGSSNIYSIKLYNLATEPGWYNIKFDIRFRFGGYTHGSANFDFDPPGMSQGHDPVR